LPEAIGLTPKKIQIRWRKWLTVSVTMLAIGFYIQYAVQNFNEIPLLNWSLASAGTALFSVALVVFSIGIAGTIWYLLLRDNVVSINGGKLRLSLL